MQGLPRGPESAREKPLDVLQERLQKNFTTTGFIQLVAEDTDNETSKRLAEV